MRASALATSWTIGAIAALLCAASCRSTPEADAPEEPSPSGRSASPTSDASAVDAAVVQEPTVDRCLRYRRQRASTLGPARAQLREVTVPTPVDPNPPALGAGPILGAVTDTSVKVWIRADRPAGWSVRVWPKAAPDQPLVEALGPRLTAATDYADSVSITGLEPERDYAFAVSLSRLGEAKPVAVEVAQGDFRTLPPEGAPARTRIVFGADITGSGDQPIFRQIHELGPSFLLLLGDNVYADEAELTLESYAQLYRRNWNIKYLREMFRHVPSFMIWDDHDIQDNYWLGKSERYEPARAAYDLYVQSHNPAPFRSGELHYVVRLGDVSMFVMDVRSQRSPNQAPDGPDKTMLGPLQKQDFLDWLRCEPARLKLIASPVLWSDWAMTGFDPWRSYFTEREELLSVIARESLGDVLLLSGDQHWSAVFRFEREDYRFYEFLPTPLSKSRGFAPTEKSDEILARDDDHFVFGVVDIDTTVDPVSIALTLCAADEPCLPGEEPPPGTALDADGEDNVPFTIRLTSRDLGLPK